MPFYFHALLSQISEKTVLEAHNDCTSVPFEFIDSAIIFGLYRLTDGNVSLFNFTVVLQMPSPPLSYVT